MKQKVKKYQQEIKDFIRSDKRKVMFSIENMQHKDVANIMYGTLIKQLIISIRFLCFVLLYPMPFSAPKVWFYRFIGMTIGDNVYISPGCFIEVIHPELISIGDNVMIGTGCNIVSHERSMKKMTIGRVKIGNNVILGGMSLVRAGVYIGNDCEIDAMVNVAKSIPSGTRVASNCRN